MLEKGCFNTSLQKSSMIVAVFFLVCILLNLIFNFSSTVESIVGTIFVLLANVSLLYGAKRNNKWMVLVWLIVEALFYIGWAMMLIGIIFNYGSYRHYYKTDNLFVAIFIHLIDLAINTYCTLIVYSYHKELRSVNPLSRSFQTV